MAKRPGATWDATNRKLEAAEASAFGIPWNGSPSSPPRLHTNDGEPPVRPVQFDSRQTWVGEGKSLTFIQPAPTTGTCPQVQRVPSRRNASVQFHGQQTAAQSLLVPTCTGLVWRDPGPIPNWPIAFSPQAHIVPSARSATEWLAAAATP